MTMKDFDILVQDKQVGFDNYLEKHNVKKNYESIIKNKYKNIMTYEQHDADILSYMKYKGRYQIIAGNVSPMLSNAYSVIDSFTTIEECNKRIEKLRQLLGGFIL